MAPPIEGEPMVATRHGQVPGGSRSHVAQVGWRERRESRLRSVLQEWCRTRALFTATIPR